MSLVQDLRHAGRVLASRPGFFLAAAGTLAIGLCANVTIFSIVNGLLLRPLPFGDRSDRIVTLHATHRLLPRDFSFGDTEISYPDLVDLQQARSFEDIGAYLTRSFTLSGGEAGAERVRGASVTPNLFPLLNVAPVLGRHFLSDEGMPPGLESSVMLTDGLWRRRYGADPDIVGRDIIVNERARTVVGILPPGFRFPERDELYMPFRPDNPPRAARNVNAVAVRRSGVTLEQAQAEVDGIAARMAADYPDTNRGFGIQVMTFRGIQVGNGTRTIAAVLMAAAAFVMLIVCANLANLMLVRGASRQRELAVRAAMGASPGRLASGALAESALLAAAGTIGGLLASLWLLDWVVTRFPEGLPYWVRFDVDLRVLLFTAGIAAAAAAAIGLMPALRAIRPDLVADLREGGRGASLGRGGRRLQSVLAVVQVGLCLALLVGANLMVRSFLAVQRADLGFDDRPLVTARGYLAGDQYDDLTARAAFFARAIQALGAMPGAASAAVTTALPGDDGGAPAQIVVDGRTADGDELAGQLVGISGGYFATLGAGMLDGRGFLDAEATDPDSDVALVSRRLADSLWPGERAVDRRIGLETADGISWRRIVGVAPDLHYEEVGEQTDSSRLTVYVPYARAGYRSVAFVVRATGDPHGLVGAARRTLQGVSAGFPVFRIMTLPELRRFTTWDQRFFGLTMSAFAGAAVLLACLGVYALVAYSIGRRSREIGVRVALGASPARVVAMLLRESAVVAMAGTILGVLLGVAVARALAGAIYGVSADAWLFASMLAPLLLVLFAATWLPARRAASADATIALRED